MNTSPLGSGYPALASNGGSAGARFVPHNFQYNGRVALALLPSLAVLAGYGGNAVAAALAVRRLPAAVRAGLPLLVQPSAASIISKSSLCMIGMPCMQRHSSPLPPYLPASLPLPPPRPSTCPKCHPLPAALPPPQCALCSWA